MKERKSKQSLIQTKLIPFFLCLALCFQVWTVPALAKPAWPSDTGAEGDAGIVVDEETGAVLFGQNIHVPYAPASITKLLTALVVIENCESLDEVVTFSHDAVYNVESGSGNVLSLEEGDQLTVRDCLFVMLLRSSNQAANALAEHVGGSRDGFVAMMNERIREIGCTESNFANPSGLNDENQYVSAYDMALIGRAAFQNETLMEIDSTTRYQLPATINNPEGASISMEHKLLITEDAGSDTYYPSALAGKTGFTSIALNTLVTLAREGERGQVCVILRSNKTHYSDTIRLMDFGFSKFENLDASGDEASLFGEEKSLLIGDTVYHPEDLEVWGSRKVTVPLGATLADVTRELITGEEMSTQAPEGAVAEIRYTYDDRVVGRSFLVTPKMEEAVPPESQAGEEGTESGAADPESQADPEAPGSDQGQPQKGIAIPASVQETILKAAPFAAGAAVLAALLVLIILVVRRQRRLRREAEERRRERRRQRLAEIGCSEEEFRRMLEERYGRDR